MYKAFIFDMDGVIVNNHNYHVKAWKKFCKELNIEINEGEFRRKYFGKGNYDILSGLLNRQLSIDEAKELGERKEAVYREVYKNHIEVPKGLESFLKELKKGEKLIAVATSAPVSNLDFVLDNLKIRHYFDLLTNGDQVQNAKPHPEIYLKTAENLKVPVKECIVFEDSVSGIQSATSAGMKVIAMLTTHQKKELPEAELFIKDFTEDLLFKYLNIN